MFQNWNGSKHVLSKIEIQHTVFAYRLRRTALMGHIMTHMKYICIGATQLDSKQEII